MRKLAAVIGALALVGGLFGAAVLEAQQQGPGAAITQTGSRGDAAIRCDSATNGTAANVLTLQNPGSGLSNYITYIGNFGDVSGSVVVATPTALSTTGFNGTSAAFMPVDYSSTGTYVTGARGGQGIVFGNPIKGNANTAQTLVNGPAVISGVTNVLEACYFAAP